MTTIEMLAGLNNLAVYLKDNQQATAELKAIKDGMIEKINAETAVSTGVATVTKMILRMLKTASKRRSSLGYAIIDDDGKQLVCDGYRAYRLNKALPLPALPDDVSPMDITYFLNNCKQQENVSLPAPTAKEVAAYIKVSKAENGKGHVPTWDFGSDAPTVDAQYLKELLTVFPDAKIFASRENTHLSSLYVTSERGDGLLYPMRVPEKSAALERKRAVSKVLRTLGNQDVCTSGIIEIDLQGLRKIADVLNA